MKDFLPENRPILLLAPMQAVTDLPFMRVMQRFGGPDVYVTEYFRVYENSILDKYILRSITENPTGRPVFAQMIGQDIPALLRTVKLLERHPVAGIDLNLGCPAPGVCRKDAGGGLLRNPEKVDRILGALREAVEGRFTVKTRLGYDSHEEFEDLLGVFKKHGIDALTIHGRTVKERYQTPVHPDCVKRAVEEMDCPVIANGNVVTVETGQAYLAQTGAAGLMIGRGAIRNPWLFDQIRASFGEGEMPRPTGRDLLGYVRALWEETSLERQVFEEDKQVHMMKRFLCYMTQGLQPEFDYQIRRVSDEKGFFGVCEEFLDHDRVVPDEPPEESKRFCGFGKLLA
ncbi:MAG: tRNA-dihydrouridine synthase [Akkermansiaceae bacterium]|nr:tRNA-dihydrouridine synthase [Akkermansiaceae bacterium]